MKSYKSIYYLIFTFFTFHSCVEVFDIESLTYENFLVVEAIITNEFKQHEVKLSRTFEIDSLGPRTESNAIVYIIDEAQNKLNFTETSSGIYTSDDSFAAEENKSYTLKIKTNTGENYTSTTQKLTTKTTIEAINYSVGNNNLDEQVVSFSVNSYNPENNANYYRYEYEETYKIIAPYYSNYKCIVISEAPLEVIIVPRNENVRTCYKTQYSNKIIQTETKSLSEDAVVNFPVRIISIDDFIITNRYSILVKQYVQNPVAYEYYNLLNSFSSNDTYFNQIQTGYFSGNINSETNSEEKVVGFFEISSVSEKRLFFNRNEYTTLVPEFLNDCSLFAPTFSTPSGFSPLLTALKKGQIFYDYNSSSSVGLGIGPYILVNKICGECTEIGTTEKPNFWVD